MLGAGTLGPCRALYTNSLSQTSPPLPSLHVLSAALAHVEVAVGNVGDSAIL